MLVKSIFGHPSISKTGAVRGDLVRCVSSNDARYVKGAIFVVIEHFGRAHINTGIFLKVTDAEARRGGVPYQIPSEGFGATWEKVSDET